MTTDSDGKHGQRGWRTTIHKRVQKYEALTIDGRIVASRRVWPTRLGRSGIRRPLPTKATGKEADTVRVCGCTGDLDVDLLCPAGCFVDICPQFAGMAASDLHRFAEWYIYNAAPTPDTTPAITTLAAVMEVLELVELMLPESSFFTEKAKAQTRPGGRYGGDSMRILPAHVNAGGSELAGRSRIRKFLLPRACEKLSSLLSAPLRLPFVDPSHSPTVLSAPPDAFILRSLFDSVTDVELDAAPAGRRWTVVRSKYLVANELAEIIRGVLRSEIKVVQLEPRTLRLVQKRWVAPSSTEGSLTNDTCWKGDRLRQQGATYTIGLELKDTQHAQWDPGAAGGRPWAWVEGPPPAA